MAIQGLTHDIDTGASITKEQYRGKINMGWGPGEGPNKTNAPMACGHFIVMKQDVTKTRLPSGRIVENQKWSENKAMQAQLCGSKESPNANYKMGCGAAPKYIEFICLHHTPDEFWSSELAKYNSSHRRLCHSNGKGTVAMELKERGSLSAFEPRKQVIDGTEWDRCPFRSCPDYGPGRPCGAHGHMKIFPAFDIATSPYEFKPTSIITISNIESEIDRLWNLMQKSHMIRQFEAGKEIPFEGFFGHRMVLEAYQAMIKGENQWVARVRPSKAMNEFIMGPIKRQLAANHNLLLAGENVTPLSVTQQPLTAPLSVQLEMAKPDADEFDGIEPPEVLDAEVVESESLAESASALMDQ